MAFEADISKSSVKFVLVTLADYANDSGEAYPSIERICKQTALNRKTVLAAFKTLVEDGFISDSGGRKGQTKSVKIWKLSIYSGAKNGTTKQAQKRSRPKNGAVPKTDMSKPKNGTAKQYQKRDIEPSVLLTPKEPPEFKRGKTPACKPITSETWAAYSQAYREHYGVEPVRNASVNGQLANFVKRIGAGEAPQVAAFYLQSRNSYYTGRGHSVGAMLADAEKLRTEWATGRQVTATKARQADKSQTNFDAVSGAMKILEGRR